MHKAKLVAFKKQHLYALEKPSTLPKIVIKTHTKETDQRPYYHYQIEGGTLKSANINTAQS